MPAAPEAGAAVAAGTRPPGAKTRPKTRRLRRIGTALLILVGVLVLVPLGGAGFLRLFRPVVRAPSSEVVDRTPARLARGTYLVESLLACKHCHSPPDTERYGMPVPPGAAELTGGILLDRSFKGFPGVVQAPNITPDHQTGIGSWTDGEIGRAIREGVNRQGRAIFPSMPYGDFRTMSDEDLRSVIVYLRSLAPVRRATRPIEVDFPVSLFIRMEPRPVAGPVPAPDPADRLAYGEYLVRMASCKACHTPADKGRRIESEAFSGGYVFEIPTSAGRRRVVTANITPDPTGYFGHATRQEWIGRVRSFATIRDNPPKVQPGLNTLMPWLQYTGLTDDDLGAIYDFMKTVRPVRKVLNPFPDAPAAAPPAVTTAATAATATTAPR
jgi:hypothetical protein